MIKFIVQETISLKQAIDNYAPELKQTEIDRIFKDKDVKVNGAKQTENFMLAIGDEVVLYEKKGKTKPVYTKVYEDDRLLVADKESGVSSEGLYHYLLRGGDYRFLHRLDRNTTGLMLFAKDDETEVDLLRAIKERSIIKTYIAVCVGKFSKNSQVLKDWLVKNNENSLVKVYKNKVVGAKEIVTEYSVKSKNGELNLVEIILHTGRTHQIRAHMASIGCPVLGDGKYGDKNKNKKYGFSRQLLCAKKIEINGIPYLQGKTFESARNFSCVFKEK